MEAVVLGTTVAVSLTEAGAVAAVVALVVIGATVITGFGAVGSVDPATSTTAGWSRPPSGISIRRAAPRRCWPRCPRKLTKIKCAGCWLPTIPA